MAFVFVAQLLIPGFTDIFVLDTSAWTEVWRFVSSIFLHGGVGHLLYNLFALMLFGSVLEALIGGKRFLFVFFATGIISNLISVNFYPSSLGASGAIFGVIGALILVRPLQVVWAFSLPMPIFVAGILWAIGDIIGAIGFLAGNPIDNTGNIAHLLGMGFGLLLGIFYRRKFRKGKRNERFKLDEKTARDWENNWMRI